MDAFRSRAFPIRKVLGAILLVLSGVAGGEVHATAASAEAQPDPRVVAITWDLAQTLVALGVPPVAVTDVPGYRKWVSAPRLPDSTIDAGRRIEPNLSVLAATRPTLIVLSRFEARLKDRLSRIAPVASFKTFPAGHAPLEHFMSITEKLAERLDRRDRLATLRSELTQALADLSSSTREILATSDSAYVVQFQDTEHVRVYGRGSTFQAVLERGGLTNAWNGATNAWGFATVPFTSLDNAADHMIILNPVPRQAEDLMRESPIWRALPVVKARRVHRLDPVWAAGGVPSAIRFAELLAKALRDSR